MQICSKIEFTKYVCVHAYTYTHTHTHTHTDGCYKNINIYTIHIMQVFIYDGKTGEKLGSLGGDTAHSGGIYAVSTSL